MSAPTPTMTIEDASSSGPFVVGKLKIQPGGVDFLGLRTVNFDMMDACLPGVNNVTEHIRLYSLIAWAWWRAGESVKATGGQSALQVDIREFVERVETLFTWSHKLAGVRGAPGMGAKPRQSVEPYSLEFSAWGRVAENTSIMAAVQYGPSVKYPDGIGYLLPGELGLFAVNDAVMPAVRALDASIQKCGHYAFFERLRSFRAASDIPRQLFDAWDLRHPAAAERITFRKMFYIGQADRQLTDRWHKRATARSEMIDLLREFLRQAERPLAPVDIRRIVLNGKLPNGRSVNVSKSLDDAYCKLAMLQVRQGQRLALEALLSWIEYEVTSRFVKTIDELVEHAASEIGVTYSDLKSARVVRDLRSAAASSLLESTHNEAGDLLSVMQLLQEASKTADTKQRMPAYAIRLLLMCSLLAERHTGSEIGQRLFRHGFHPRISLKTLSDAISEFADVPVTEFLRFVLESFVLAQHFVTAVSRNVDQTQRLRLVLEEDGLRFLAREPLGFFPTPDRLATGLSLMSECGLCEHVLQTGGDPLYRI